VLIQTLTPRHPVLLAVAAHDYRVFFRSEISVRRDLGYPPFSRLALVRFSGPEAAAAEDAAEAAVAEGRRLAAAFAGRLEILGPVPSPLARLRGLYRFQALVRAAAAETRRRFLRQWLPSLEKGLPPGLRLTLDIDPYHLL
jgi:primosomal protein N' (replication factor Y)